MSDLISRSELLEIIKGSEELLDFQKDECIACINSCDIAYDIDKVVEELETMSQHITFKDMFETHENVRMVSTDIAIEIAKQGGVSDDVCERKLEDEEFCYCHNDYEDEKHDCLDYMECEECPYYYADLDLEGDD